MSPDVYKNKHLATRSLAIWGYCQTKNLSVKINKHVASSSSRFFQKTHQNVEKSQGEQINSLPSIVARSTKKFPFSSFIARRNVSSYLASRLVTYALLCCRINFYKSGPRRNSEAIIMFAFQQDCQTNENTFLRISVLK